MKVMTYDLGIKADLILLHFSDIVFFFLNKLKVCGKFTLSRSVGNICSFLCLSLSLILVILMISASFFITLLFAMVLCVVTAWDFTIIIAVAFFFSNIVFDYWNDLCIRLLEVLVVACEPLVAADQGSNLSPLHWECEVWHWTTRNPLKWFILNRALCGFLRRHVSAHVLGYTLL